MNPVHASTSGALFTRATASCVLIVSVASSFSVATESDVSLASPRDGDLASVLSLDKKVADAATQRLRDRGPEGLRLLMTALEGSRVSKGKSSGGRDRMETAKLLRVIDRVAAQKDAHVSGLYWYTDLAAAMKAAAAAGKPIVSLRLLGRLDEALSCANSRFFRTILYANKEVSAHLREHFVLHWESVRPAPKITIDFGDGRVMQRTVTGNSIHHVLTAGGRPVDALPGVYGPKAFLEQLEPAREAALRVHAIATTPDHMRRQSVASVLQAYHSARVHQLARRFADDLEAIGETAGALPKLAATNARPHGKTFVSALEAAPVALTKAGTEVVHLKNVLSVTHALEQQGDTTSDDVWRRIAERHAVDAMLGPGSIELMRAQLPAFGAGARALSKRAVEDPMLTLVSNFQRSIAEDTVRNEYLLHSRIHQWFIDGGDVTADVVALNRQVYADLFLTPDGDPWLGLVQEDVYTALTNNGILARQEVR